MADLKATRDTVVNLRAERDLVADLRATHDMVAAHDLRGTCGVVCF